MRKVRLPSRASLTAADAAGDALSLRHVEELLSVSCVQLYRHLYQLSVVGRTAVRRRSLNSNSRVDPLVVPHGLASRAGRLPRFSLVVSARTRAFDALSRPKFASRLRILAGHTAALPTSLGIHLRVRDCLGHRSLSSLAFAPKRTSGLPAESAGSPDDCEAFGPTP